MQFKVFFRNIWFKTVTFYEIWGENIPQRYIYVIEVYILNFQWKNRSKGPVLYDLKNYFEQFGPKLVHFVKYEVKVGRGGRFISNRGFLEEVRLRVLQACVIA